MSPIKICKSCKNEFEGNYCNQCGEKIVESKDFTLANILSQAFSTVTNFDSKVFRTMKLLFFFPGKLSSKYVEGIRVPYMRPFQIFVISNIIFFIFLSETDLFRSPSKWFFSENFDGIKVMDKVRYISSTKNISTAEIANMYDNRSSDLAKGLIILLIPFIAMVNKIFNPKKAFEFGKHIIFSTHYFSFILLMCVIISELIKISDFDFNKWMFLAPIVTLITIYNIVGMKIFYNNNWLTSSLKGIVGVLIILKFMDYYRMGINLLSLHSI